MSVSQKCCAAHQGPLLEIAHNIGFSNVTTMEELAVTYRKLDVVDHIRREIVPEGPVKDIPPIEAIVLFGEPIRCFFLYVRSSVGHMWWLRTC